MENKIQIDNGAVKVSLQSEGIIAVEYADDYCISLPTAQEITEVIRSLAGKNRKAILHIPGMYTTHEEGVREYLTEMSHCKGKAAEAIVIRNLQHRIKANFYLRINRPACPTMLFESAEEAEKWLKTCICQN